MLRLLVCVMLVPAMLLPVGVCRCAPPPCAASVPATGDDEQSDTDCCADDAHRHDHQEQSPAPPDEHHAPWCPVVKAFVGHTLNRQGHLPITAIGARLELAFDADTGLTSSSPTAATHLLPVDEQLPLYLTFRTLRI